MQSSDKFQVDEFHCLTDILAGRIAAIHPVTTVLKSQLTHLNYDATLYNTHSFRIGRASDMATEGYSENQIAMVGRWNSDAYKRYIKPDRITCI